MVYTIQNDADMAPIPPEISDLNKLVQPHLGDGQLVSSSTRYLTKPGDNYGSIMLSLVANVKCANGEMEELPLVAKLPPITNEFYWKIFQPERTCLSENAAYQYLAPELRKIQLEAGIKESELFNGFPRCYGSRISLDPNATVVDRDAVLVLENLQTCGYKPGNRHKMYDLEHTEFVMTKMAKFHALPIALRLKKPEVFDKKIRPYFKSFYLNANLTKEELEQFNNEAIKEAQLATNNNEEVVDRVKELANLYYEQFGSRAEVCDSPYTTISHCDLWINNIMLKYDEAGKIARLKFVDFQIAQYGHIAYDIVFFLFSSVETKILEEYYYDLLELYFKAFIESLESVGICTEKYHYKDYLNEIQRIGPAEIWHALFMTKIILADSSTMPEDFKDMDLNIMKSNCGRAEITERTADVIRLAQKFKFF